MRRPSPAPAAQVVRFALGLGIALLPLSVMDLRARTIRTGPTRFDYNAPPHLRDKPVFRIVAFGSSSTFGTGASSAALSYPARLERRLNGATVGRKPVEVVNRGISGEDTRNMARRVSSDIASRQADLVIWQTGSNDAIRHVPLATYEAILRDGIAELRASGAELMLMEPQWCPQLEQSRIADPYIAVLRRVAADTATILIPRYEIMKRWIATGVASADELIGPDHLHSTDRGYELLADAVAQEVVSGSKTYRSAVLDSPARAELRRNLD